MTVSTYDGELWSAPVYYITDINFNFYFISSPKTRHALAIKQNPNVAVTIADSHQKITDSKVGIQMQGVASVVSRLESIQWFFKMFNAHLPGVSEILNFANYKEKVITSKVYRITPKIIQLFHEGLYSDSPIEATKMFILSK
jgi:uncharacterized protein YhbP (UPF0306 family)